MHLATDLMKRRMNGRLRPPTSLKVKGMDSDLCFFFPFLFARMCTRIVSHFCAVCNEWNWNCTKIGERQFERHSQWCVWMMVAKFTLEAVFICEFRCLLSCAERRRYAFRSPFSASKWFDAAGGSAEVWMKEHRLHLNNGQKKNRIRIEFIPYFSIWLWPNPLYVLRRDRNQNGFKRFRWKSDSTIARRVARSRTQEHLTKFSLKAPVSRLSLGFFVGASLYLLHLKCTKSAIIIGAVISFYARWTSRRLHIAARVHFPSQNVCHLICDAIASPYLISGWCVRDKRAVACWWNESIR